MKTQSLTPGGGLFIAHTIWREYKKGYYLRHAASAYIVYIRERHYFSLVYTNKRATNNLKVKIDIQKGALTFGEIFDNRCAQGVDSSYHTQTNMIARRGISVHSIHKGEVFIFFYYVHWKRVLRILKQRKMYKRGPKV